MAQPVIGCYLAGNIQNQATKRISLIGIGLYAPVGTIDIFFNRRSDIDQRPSVLTQTMALVTIRGIGTESLGVIGIDKHLLDDVLNLLNSWRRSDKPMAQNFQRSLREQLGFIFTKISGSSSGFGQRDSNPVGIERNIGPVTFDNTLRQGRQYGWCGRYGIPVDNGAFFRFHSITSVRSGQGTQRKQIQRATEFDHKKSVQTFRQRQFSFRAPRPGFGKFMQWQVSWLAD